MKIRTCLILIVSKGQVPWDKILTCMMSFDVWSKFCPKSQSCLSNFSKCSRFFWHFQFGLNNCFCKSFKKCTIALPNSTQAICIRYIICLNWFLGREKKICMRSTVVGIKKCCPKSIGPFPLLAIKYYWIYDKPLKVLFS